MAKKNRARLAKGRDVRGPMQRIVDREAAEKAARPTLDPHTARHGDYERQGVVYVNRGGTPVDRWKAAGLLSDSQLAAINHCIRLWSVIGASGGLVANLDRTVFGAPGEGHHREVEAREDLSRMKAHVGPKLFAVFENVVRFDEPAGVAGSRLSGPASGREAKARACVQFVADVIAWKERLVA